MIYGIVFFDIAKAFDVTAVEFLYLYMIRGLSMQERNNYWCVAPNSYFADTIGVSLRTIQYMSDKLEKQDLLVRAPGTRRRVSESFSDALMNTSAFNRGAEFAGVQNLRSVQNLHGGGAEFAYLGVQNLHGKGAEFAPNNNTDNNKYNNKNNKKSEVLKNERNHLSTDDRSGNHPSGQQPGKAQTKAEQQLTDHLPENTEKPFSKKEKKVAPKKEKESQLVQLPFGEKFAEAWAEWKAEKKAAHKFTYTERGEKAALAKLVNEAGTEKVAIAMIEQAIAHGWQGIYGLKQDKQPARIAAPQETIDSLTDRSRWTIAKHVDDEDLPF